MRLYIVGTDDGEINKFFDIIMHPITRYFYLSIWFNEEKKKLASRGKGKSRKESSLKLQSFDSSVRVKTF